MESPPPPPLKKASLAARVFSAWLELVDAKLSDDLYRLKDDLFKFVLDELSTESPLAKLPVDLFKLLMDMLSKLVGRDALLLSLLLRLSDLGLLDVCAFVSLDGTFWSSLDGATYNDNGLDREVLFVLGFTNTGYRGRPLLLSLSFLLPATTELPFVETVFVTTFETVTLLELEVTEGTLFVRSPDVPLTTLDCPPVGTELTAALTDCFNALFLGSELSLVGGNGTPDLVVSTVELVVLLFDAGRGTNEDRTDFRFSPSDGLLSLLDGQVIGVVSIFADVGWTCRVGGELLRLFCALTITVVFGFPKNGPASGDGDFWVFVGDAG